MSDLSFTRAVPIPVPFYAKRVDDISYWGFTPPDFKDSFRREFKEMVPYEMRSYDQTSKMWLIREDWADVAEDILHRHFKGISIVYYGEDDL